MDYTSDEPARSAVDTLPGPTVIEFGSPTCSWCRAAQPLILQAMAERPGLRHLKIADGRGRPLGRSFQIKLWPTLVYLRDGQELGRSVRPADVDGIRAGLASIDPPAADQGRDRSQDTRQDAGQGQG